MNEFRCNLKLKLREHRTIQQLLPKIQNAFESLHHTFGNVTQWSENWKLSHGRDIFLLRYRMPNKSYLVVFSNPSPPRMFLSLNLLWDYRIQHCANRPLYVTSSFSTWIFCRGISGFATDCPCGVWCRGLTTCLLHVGPSFGNRILNNSWAVGLT